MNEATLPREAGFPLWRRQALAVLRLESGRSFSIRRSLWLFSLAFAPVFIILMHATQTDDHSRGPETLREETLILAGIIQVFYIRLGIFFGCLGLALRLFRGDMAEKTLHYPFLAPLRREVLVAGKFLSAAVSAILLFATGVTASFLLMYLHFDAGREFVLAGPGLRHLWAYLLAVVLGCLGYLALTLAVSLLFKNPIVPSVMVVVWEGINGALPLWLKPFSVTYYLKPLFPVELPVEGISGLFTVVAEPVPLWVSVVGLLAFAGLALAFACWRVRRLEISYSTD
jgi:ABC-type transport system involved in multi-copper enzyme maturation permease subunit